MIQFFHGSLKPDYSAKSGLAGTRKETSGYQTTSLNERIISSAVSTVLRVQEFPVAAAAVAEQCGYGDLR